jgi:hypothetical protein
VSGDFSLLTKAALRRFMQEKGLQGDPVAEPVAQALEAEVAQLLARDKTPPTLELPEKVAFDPDKRGAPVRGKATDESGVASVTVEGVAVELEPDGSFQKTVWVAVGEEHEVEVVAKDAAGNAVSRKVLVSRKQDAMAEVADQLVPLDPRKLRGQPQPDAAAIIIGVSSYQNLPTPAAYADQDAKAFFDYANFGLGVPENRILLMTNNQATINVVFLEIKKKLQELVRAGPIGQIYVYFSGHGFAIDKKPAFLTFDFDPDLPDRTSISEDALLQFVAREGRPAKVTLFADACFSGRARDGQNLLPDARNLTFDVEPAPADQSAAVLTSSGPKDLSVALEPVKHGAFSYVLMRGLQGEADLDGDKRITLRELYKWAETKLPKLAESLGKAQEPYYNGADPDRVVAQLQ